MPPSSYCELPLQGLDHRRVEAFWSFAPFQTATHRVLPDGRMDLLARFRLQADGRVSGVRLVIAGPAQRFSTLPTGHDTAFLGIRFRAAWGGACLGINPADLRDGVLLGDAALRVLGKQSGALLLRARSVEQLMRALSDTAADMAVRAPLDVARQRAIAAIELLQQSGGRMPVATLAARVSVSERTLRRDILHSAGLPVKSLASVLRFQRTLRLMHLRPQASLTDIALDGSYSDQAHMTREFRRLGGFTPGARPAYALINLPPNGARSLDLA